MKRALGCAALLAGILAMRPAVLSACDPISRPAPERMAFLADLIVRARAVDYTYAPSSVARISGTPESVVHFRIEEIVKGGPVPTDLDLPGYLGGENDFNKLPVPYQSVRHGSSVGVGNCFANTYRQGADYLLVLKLINNAYTAEWYALGPTNEQLRSVDDPWLKWMRTQIGPRISSSPSTRARTLSGRQP